MYEPGTTPVCNSDSDSLSFWQSSKLSNAKPKHGNIYTVSQKRDPVTLERINGF